MDEMDMDDMFWEIPTQDVFKALTWSIKKVQWGRSPLLFSLAKGGQRAFD